MKIVRERKKESGDVDNDNPCGTIMVGCDKKMRWNKGNLISGAGSSGGSLTPLLMLMVFGSGPGSFFSPFSH